jgi:hypothetical protein
LSVKILNETEFFKAFNCDLQGEFDSNEVKKFRFSYLEQKELIFDPNRVDHISRETAWAKLGAKRKAVQDALDYAKEKAIKDKAAEDKAAAKEKQEAANNSRIEAANNSRKEAANNSRNVKKKTIQSAKELEAVEAENGKPGNKKKNHIENSTIVLLGASMKEMLKKSTEELSKTLKQNISVLESSTKAQINKVLQSSHATEKEIKGLALNQKNLTSTVTDLGKRMAELEDKIKKQEAESTIQAKKKKSDKKHKTLDFDTDTESDDSDSGDEYVYVPLSSATPPAYHSSWAPSLPQSVAASFPHMMYPQSPQIATISHHSHPDPTKSYM